MFVVGITGTFASGKSDAARALVEMGYAHLSMSEYITIEVIRRGLPVNRDSMRIVANDLRKEYGSAHIVDVLYKRAQDRGLEKVVIESLRNVAEVQYLKRQDHLVLAVDALPQVRHERAYARRSGKDYVTYEKFSEQEASETGGSEPWEQDLSAAMKLADITLYNNHSLKAFLKAVEGIVSFRESKTRA